jgi:DNA-binding transcriptional ArsR family regulator
MEPFVADQPKHHKALAHPLRHRILLAIGRDGATTSQLARTLKTNKGNIAHHLGVLHEAGLVRLGERRQVRGGTEQYWLGIGRKMLFPGGDRGANTAAMMQAVADGMEADPGEPMVNLRHLRLTPQQAKALAKHLNQLVDDLRPAGNAQPAYGVIVGVYRSGEPRR